MSYQIDYEDNGHGAIVVFTGFVTGQEIIEHVRAIYARDVEHRLLWKVGDFLGVDVIDISNDEIRELARLREERVEDYPLFLNAVVATEPLLKSSSSVLSVYADRVDGFRSETFSSVAAARRWINSILGEYRGP